MEFASPSCLFCRNWAAGADGGSCRAGRNGGGCGRIPPEASSTSGGESESERNTSTCSSIPLPSLVVPPTPLPRHHRCVLKKFVALETERRSTRTVFLFFFYFIFVPEALNGEVARCFQNIPRAPNYTKQ